MYYQFTIHSRAVRSKTNALKAILTLELTASRSRSYLRLRACQWKLVTISIEKRRKKNIVCTRSNTRYFATHKMLREREREGERLCESNRHARPVKVTNGHLGHKSKRDQIKISPFPLKRTKGWLTGQCVVD